MFVIESCQKIEYNALFMMIFIPVSNFGDQPLHISGSAYFCKIFFLLSQLFKETLEEGWLSAVRFKYKPGHPHEI
jgi:hypothetical protein